MNRPEENSMATGFYKPDVDGITELAKIISLLSVEERREVKGFALAHLSIAAKGQEVQPPQNRYGRYGGYSGDSDIARQYANTNAR